MALTARHALPEGIRLSAPAIPRPGRRAVSLALGSLFFLLLIDALVHPRAFFDLWAITAIQRVESPGVYTGINLVETLTSSTGAVLMWGVVLVAFAALRWWSSATVAALLPLGGIINEFIGIVLVSRTRPHLDELTRSSGNWNEGSFPSGHVMGAVLLYGLLFAAAGAIRSDLIRRVVRGFSVLVISTVGFSRVWDGAHWPTDVLGAYTLGGLLLVGMITLQARLRPAIDGLPLIKAQALPHDQSRQHAHALTSLVLFDGDQVTKVYAPGLLPRVLYWLAFQAPFPYASKEVALRAAMHRRNLAGMLTEYWYGDRRVARILGVGRESGRLAVTSERIDGAAPANRHVAKAFLSGLTARFEAAGLPTWQIDPIQPRAIDNLLETADGHYHIVDLESGLVSPVASRTTWFRALRRGLVPFYDEVFFDVTRSYLAREDAHMRQAMGAPWLTDLHTTIDVAEAEARAWHAAEPRLWHKMLTGFGFRSWPARVQIAFAAGQDKARSWMEREITTWEGETRISADEAAQLRMQMAEPTFERMLPYLGGHILLSIPLRFPVGSIVRPILVAGALGAALLKFARRRIDRNELGLAWSIHSPLVMLFAGIPGVGSFAYLAAKPVRANRLLLRVLADAAAAKAPWRLYERSGFRRFVARPTEADVAARADQDQLQSQRETARADVEPRGELGWTISGTSRAPVAGFSNQATMPTPQSMSVPCSSSRAA